MKELTIAATSLRRTLRERSSIFFLVLFPMLMILVLGVAFGGSFSPRVGVVTPHTPLAERLADSLHAAPGIAVVAVAEDSTAIASVEHGDLEAAVILPADLNTPLRYVVRPGIQGQQISSIVTAVLDREEARLRAAAFVAAENGLSLPEAQSRVDAIAPQFPPAPVDVTYAGPEPARHGRFDAMASSELLLFMFLVAMTNSVALIESRRLGVMRRMLATPTSTGTIIRGEGLARLSVSLLQAVIIMVGSALLFQVRWGDPVAAALLVAAFAVVASGFGLLLGTIARTSEVAIGAGLLLSLGMAALGGAMMPLDLFSSTMRKVAHLTPHAWAADGFSELARHNAGIADIATELAVLWTAGFAVFGVAAWLLRRRLARQAA